MGVAAGAAQAALVARPGGGGRQAVRAGGLVEAPGYFYVTAPTHGAGWVSQPFTWLDASDPNGISNSQNWGQVAFRYFSAATVGYCDGHADVRSDVALRDMTLWSNEARRTGNTTYDP